jgi:putative intracellular protease/amidase
MSSQSLPTKFGLLLYPGFEVLDVFGPLEALNVISRKEFEWIGGPYIPNITLSIITTTKTLEPVSAAQGDGMGAVLGQRIVPQHTIYHAPEDLEVLLIPGGLGSSDVSEDAVGWVRKMVPKLRFLITVCTGADIAARAGALCGLRATTNKQAWVSSLR